MKKLKDPVEPVDRLLRRARSLGPHFGPVLYRLPPAWQLDLARLEHFLHVLPQDVQHVRTSATRAWNLTGGGGGVE